MREEESTFQNGRLVQGSLFIDGDGNLPKIRSALTAKYGQPKEFPKVSMFKWEFGGGTTPMTIQVDFNADQHSTTVTFDSGKVPKQDRF